MSRREAWLSAGVIFALAFAVRAIAAAAVGFPVPEDTAYYAGVARNVVEGRGLISDALWSYQTQPLTVPRAAFEVWMPLPSLLAALPMAVLSAANWFRAAQVVSVMAGSTLAVLAWRLGADVAGEMHLPVGRARTLAVGAGVVASLLGPLVVYGALPDSTALFAVLALAACLLMARIASGYRSGANAGAANRQLVALGMLIGLAALTRSEAIWLGLAWLAIVWRGLPSRTVDRSPTAETAERAGIRSPAYRFERLRLVLMPGVVAVLIFLPWAVRNWLTFGSPLPGQTLKNALYISYFDVFAYRDQPSLAGYLAQGPAALIGMHLAGFGHNMLDVLIIPAFPVGLIGLLVLPRVWRLTSLRPLILAALLTFAVTSLLFPVSTRSGTFLHAAGAVLVLLIVSCLAALDALIAWVARLRHWTRPVAWLGPAFAIAAIFPLTVVSVSAISSQAGDIRARYDALPAAMARAGVPLGDGPVITDFPIWLAESARIRTLALPDEPPDAVLDLARHFGAKLLIVQNDGLRQWPGILNGAAAAAECFKEVPLTDTNGGKPVGDSPLAQTRVFRIDCP
ncbi:MAG TPA: hypothetical protein VF349_04885 [Candidatus Limnocylindrales bacterium]